MIKFLPLRGAAALEAFAIDDRWVITEAGLMTVEQFAKLRRQHGSAWRLMVSPPMAAWHPVCTELTERIWNVNGARFKLVRKGVTWRVTSQGAPTALSKLKAEGFAMDSRHELVDPPLEILRKLKLLASM